MSCRASMSKHEQAWATIHIYFLRHSNTYNKEYSLLAYPTNITFWHVSIIFLIRASPCGCWFVCEQLCNLTLCNFTMCIWIITVWQLCNSLVPVRNWSTTSFEECEARALDLYLACVARKGKENFNALLLIHGHLIL